MDLDRVICGDCLDILPTIPDASIDAVITDPPYPHIKRDYGYWTEAEWWELVVEGVIPEVRRVLKPTGSAVFILQPNSRKVGSMRGWLFEFQAWVCREWNMVQDAWWWNTCQPPSIHTHLDNGLMRPAIKTCVWGGDVQCYRNQMNVLWGLSEATITRSAEDRVLKKRPSGYSNREGRMYAVAQERNGSTPFNILPIGNGGAAISNDGHGAGTPLALADWWTRYIVPPGGVVLDPFFGVGTMGIAAKKNGGYYIGIEKEERYVEIAEERIAKETAQMVMTL